MARRRVHLGIDYGTSSSKVVIRDYGAPGGERATVLADSHGEFRVPSAVAWFESSGSLVLAHNPATTAATKPKVFESVKMRAAAEIKGNVERYCFAPTEVLPPGFTAADLATLTVARLIDRGARAATLTLGNDLALGMTMGVPMSFFTDPALQKAFLRIARAAWRLWRSGSVPSDTLTIADARRCLGEAYTAVDSMPTPTDDIRDWIRSEAEAAMWWAFQSPSVPAGPYAKVDVGAGTTNASVFRIVDAFIDGRWVKEKLAFFGSYSHALGMDAVDEALAKWKGMQPERRLDLRGSEDEVLQDPSAKQACRDAISGIRKAFTVAWAHGNEKYRGSPAELRRWRDDACVFVIGGGSLVRAVHGAVARHPHSHGTPLSTREIDCPSDLELPGTRKVPKYALPFLTVAYGLSNLGLAIPEVRTPDEVDPLPSAEARRSQLDHDDIYGK